MNKKIISIILLALGSLVIYRNLLGNGIPLTHDGPSHMARMVNYYLAIRQGQFPPRWAPNLANGFGYPVFNFNYPLSDIIGLPFFLLKINYDLLFQMVILISVILGVIGWWFFLDAKKFRLKAKVFSSVLYLTNPHLISLVFVRGGVGEMLIIGIVPWLLLFTDRFIKNPSTFNSMLLGIVGALFSLSHNVLTVTALLPYLLYLIYELRAHKIFPWKKMIQSILLAFFLSAFFWLPALGELKLIILGNSPINNDLSKHYLYFSQLVSQKAGYGFSEVGPVDGLSFSFSVLEIVATMLLVSWFISRRGPNNVMVVLLLGTLISGFLSLQISQPLWNLIPYSGFIQFPWRFLWISHILLLGLIVYWIHLAKPNTILLLLLGTVAFVGVSRHAISYERVIHPKEYWITYSETTSTLNENSPINFHLYKAYEIKDTVFKDDLVWSDDPDADVHITYWNGSSRAYSILVNQPSTVVERTAYFPGWQTSANNIKVQVDFHDPWEAGLLTYYLDPGSYEIKTKFTQNTPIRKIGNWLTLVGIGWIALISVRKIKNGRG